MGSDAEIHGTHDPRFSAVRDAFAANFSAGREVGASFAATLDGEPVVDLWGGHADAARTRRWERDTIVNVYSTTKAMTALCAHMLVDRGLLDVDAPVARYWPEFAQHGKAAITVRQVLSHTAGLAAIHRKLGVEALYDWDLMVATLAAETPSWEPGSASGYHALTFGHLVGEIIRRITGQTPGAFFRAAGGCAAAGGFSYWPCRIRRPPRGRDGPGVGRRSGVRVARSIPQSLRGKVLGNPPLRPGIANTRAWRAAEIPAANGHGNARSVAHVLAALACGGTLDGVRLLGAPTLARAIEEQCYGRDLVLGFRLRWGLGFMLSSRELPLGPNPRTFGHGGWGGSLGFADLDARVSWAYVMNRMSPGTTGDSRAAGPVAALYGSLS